MTDRLWTFRVKADRYPEVIKRKKARSFGVALRLAVEDYLSREHPSLSYPQDLLIHYEGSVPA